MVKRGFAREDLFVCVHEQFMTETAQMADVVLPATMFLEHDDIYQRRRPPIHHPRAEADRAAGRMPHQPRGDLRRWRKRLGAEHPGFAMSAARADRPDAAEVAAGARWPSSSAKRWIDCQPRFRHRALPRRLRLAGRQIPLQAGLAERAVPQPVHARPGRRRCRRCPTTGPSIEEADAAHPFRLATSPARGFLNSTFNETPTSLRAGKAADGDDPSRRRRARSASPTATRSCSATRAAQVRLHARLFDGVRRGVLIAELIWPNAAYRRRQRHQHADRRRPDRALWRRRVPRQQGVDPARAPDGLGLSAVSPAYCRR